MAPLSSAAREEVWQVYMEEVSDVNEVFGDFTKWELLIAIGETDDWIDGGSRGQIKNAFSSPCDDELTTQQMDDIVSIVTQKRLEV